MLHLPFYGRADPGRMLERQVKLHPTRTAKAGRPSAVPAVPISSCHTVVELRLCYQSDCHWRAANEAPATKLLQ